MSDKIPAKVIESIEYLAEWAADHSINNAKAAGIEPYHDRDRLVAQIGMGIQAHMFDPDYESADALEMDES